jgi:hypothetical protein
MEKKKERTTTKKNHITILVYDESVNAQVAVAVAVVLVVVVEKKRRRRNHVHYVPITFKIHLGEPCDEGGKLQLYPFVLYHFEDNCIKSFWMVCWTILVDEEERILHLQLFVW